MAEPYSPVALAEKTRPTGLADDATRRTGVRDGSRPAVAWAAMATVRRDGEPWVTLRPAGDVDPSPLEWDSVPTRRVVQVGLVGTAVLIVVDLGVKYVDMYLRDVPGWLAVWDVNRENNVPTAWNALLILAAGAVAALCASVADGRSQPGRRSWIVVALLTVFLGVDELARLHERLRGPSIQVSGGAMHSIPVYAWLLLGAVLGLVALGLALWWARSLPRDVRTAFVAGVLLFGAGAVAAEALGSYVDNTRGVGRIYFGVTAVEETMEMVGALLVTVAFLRMLRTTVVDGRRAVALRRR
jgi:hypothetical protein